MGLNFETFFFPELTYITTPSSVFLNKLIYRLNPGGWIKPVPVNGLKDV